MIQTYAHQKELHESRLDLKTIETMFSNLITDGTNCSPFESEVIVEKAKEVFAIGDHSEGNILQPGQMVWTALDINEPPGKPLKSCKLRRIILTHIKPKEDTEVRRTYNRSAKRQQQITRMAVEAQEQQALLTQEDLAEILDSDVRTIRRDIQYLREQGITVPTRGQQKDIGPGVTHRVQAITLFSRKKNLLKLPVPLNIPSLQLSGISIPSAVLFTVSVDSGTTSKQPLLSASPCIQSTLTSACIPMPVKIRRTGNVSQR